MKKLPSIIVTHSPTVYKQTREQRTSLKHHRDMNTDAVISIIFIHST